MFIRLTQQEGDHRPVYLNTDHIISMVPINAGTVVATTFAGETWCWEVKEAPAEILHMIDVLIYQPPSTH